jgi:glycosyltransferase involved in cell wall biosynthesis
MENGLSISVVVITRNRAQWLREALDSLVGQSRRPDEVIVVDSASEDNTRDVVQTFGDGLNLTYVYEPVRGIPRARNAGVESAKGDIIAFMDDDCVADSDWLKYIEIPFVKDPNVGVVGGEVTYDRVGFGNVEAFYIENMNTGPITGSEL